MKKQILTIGLIFVLVLTSTVAQARRFRPRRFYVPYRQEQIQKQTEPEQTQEPIISDQGAVRAIIRVNDPNQTQEFEVKVSVDHENHIYKEGDFMTVTVKSTRSGYLYLFYKDAGGNVTVLFPNKFHQDNQIEADTPLLIPDGAMAFQLQTMAPFGQEILQALVSLKPIDLQSEINFKNNQVFNQLNSKSIDNVEQKLNQDSGLENKIAESLIAITTVPEEQTPQPQTEEPSLKKDDENAKAETIDEVPPAPGSEDDVEAPQTKTEEPSLKKDDENAKAETIDEVPPAPGSEEVEQKQELKEDPIQKQD